MAWVYGTDWIRTWYNDGVEITAMAAAKIVNPIADGRIPYLQGKPEDEYLPPVYEEADRVMSRGVADNATSEQIDQARLKAAEANLEVQKKTGDYQGAAIDVALLPLNIVTMGSGKLATTGGIKSFRLASGEAVKLALKEAGKEAGKVTLKQGAKNFGKALATDSAIDTAIEETSHGAINAANLGTRPTDSFATKLIRGANPDLIADNTVDIAQLEHANITFRLGLQEGNKQSIDKLIPNNKSLASIDDLLAILDRDEDGVLTAEDAKRIRDIIGNEVDANALFVELSDSYGITFDNQEIRSNSHAASTTPPPTPIAGGGGNTTNQKGFLSKIWDGIVEVFHKITNVFHASTDESTQLEASTVKIQTMPISTLNLPPATNDHGLPPQPVQNKVNENRR